MRRAYAPGSVPSGLGYAEAVTPARYASYRAALAMLDEARPFALPPDERRILRDCAEGLLLCRDTASDGPDCSELIGRTALSLARAVMEDRWSNDGADRAWLVLRACGPDSAPDSLAGERPQGGVTGVTSLEAEHRASRGGPLA